MRGGVVVYAAQASVQIDAEIGEKCRFRMKTSYLAIKKGRTEVPPFFINA